MWHRLLSSSLTVMFLSERLLGIVGRFSSVDHNIYAYCTVALGMSDMCPSATSAADPLQHPEPDWGIRGWRQILGTVKSEREGKRSPSGFPVCLLCLGAVVKWAFTNAQAERQRLKTYACPGFFLVEFCLPYSHCLFLHVSHSVLIWLFHGTCGLLRAPQSWIS